MNIIYSFNKAGFEATYWQNEIAAASNESYRFIPFNHGKYLDPNLYIRAQLLDDLYFNGHPRLLRMYTDLGRLVSDNGADALIVDNCFPYHPDWLRGLATYKVLRTSDGPICAYDRDFAYVHAYDHVLYHSPAYSRDMGMEEKLRYVGAKRVDFWPLGLFDQLFDPRKAEETLFAQPRDIDVLFIGALHLGKMPILAQVKNALGKTCRLHGIASVKKNLYFNMRYGFPGWITPIGFEKYVPLYQRAKIGFNVHNRGKYSLGSFRLFELPANGVMQISDGEQYLDHYFEVDKEVVSYRNTDELIETIRYYIDHNEERLEIARAGYRRVLKEYRISHLLKRAGQLIERGMASNEQGADLLSVPSAQRMNK